MTTKKWRPLWSYDTEKTEPWLSKLSSQGNRLISVNRFTRMFTFEQGPAEDVQFQVVYDKSRKPLSKVIMESNWEEVFSTGNWRFLKNDSKGISIYPSREGLLKRNRIHFYVLAGLAMFCVMPFLMMFLLIWTLLTDINSVEPSPYWWITIVYFMSVISVLVLTIFTAIKLKAFERKHFNSAVDDNEVSGKTYAKWRFAWMYEPDKLEKWLSEMAAEGNHLIRVGKFGTNFIFEKGTPSHVSFVCDYQIKTTPSYADIHKSAGWQLKFTSPYSLTKHSLWSQKYVEGEETPRFTYDDAEQKAQVRKVLLASIGFVLYMFAIVVFYFWMSSPIEQEEGGWNMFNTFIKWAIIISLLSPIMILIKTLKYALRMRATN